MKCVETRSECASNGGDLHWITAGGGGAEQVKVIDENETWTPEQGMKNTKTHHWRL